MWKISYTGEKALGGNEQLFFKQSILKKITVRN